jgi:hypothetical protein
MDSTGRHELLASKLATLLERSEIRDFVDVKALVDAGGDLHAALGDVPKKDAGFSSLTLACVLKGFDPRPAAKALGYSAAQTEELLSFRQWPLPNARISGEGCAALPSRTSPAESDSWAARGRPAPRKEFRERCRPRSARRPCRRRERSV